MSEGGEEQNPQELLPNQSFIKKIKEKNLPIDEEDAKIWADYMIDYNPPPGFLERIAASLNYIDEQTFATDYREYKKILREKLIDTSYSVLIYNYEGSANWMYRKLLESGIPPARYRYFTTQEPEAPLIPHLPPHATMVIPDDFMVDGFQMTESLEILPEGDYKTLVAVMYDSPVAHERISRQKRQFELIHIREIPPAGSTLNPEDFDFLKQVAEKALTPEELAGHDAEIARIRPFTPLFWTYYKVPDNMFAPITGFGTVPPLIREEKFTVPYRKVNKVN